MSINELLSRLVAEMTEGGIADPLTAPVSLFAVWDDLCRLADEPVPVEVFALTEAPVSRLLRPQGPAQWLVGGGDDD